MRTQHALHPYPHRHLVIAQRFARLVHQHGQAGLADRGAQRAVPDVGVQHHRDIERPGELEVFRVGQVRADLRQVEPVLGTGVQVDAVGGIGHDLGHEQVGQARGQGSPGGARKRPVEVAAVRQVAGLRQHSVGVDDGHRQQGAPDPLHGAMPHQAPHDLDTEQLVPVQRGADEKTRAVLPAPDDMDHHGHLGVGVQVRDGKLERPPGAGADNGPVDVQVGSPGTPGSPPLPGHQPLPRVLVLWSLACFSRNWMINDAISLFVAFSMPSRPGEELTSMTTGP